uniref:Uncharacterized protein n=1 Tax=Heliothis virescens TaxID=7102 RepID=A0A2A4J6T1_HELVI
MTESPEREQTSSRSNSLKMSLPTVLCTPEASDEKSDISLKANSFVSSDSKTSNLATPTSPLRLSSPLSLPTSPRVKNSSQSSTNSLLNPNPKPVTSNAATNNSLVNSGSATVSEHDGGLGVSDFHRYSYVGIGYILLFVLSCFQNNMTESPEREQTSSRSNSLKMSLPTVLCTPEASDEKSDISLKANSFVSSDSKTSNLATPTSPLRLSSPLSLPTSPRVKNSSQSSTNSLLNPNPKPVTSNAATNNSLVNSGSATVERRTRRRAGASRAALFDNADTNSL